MTAASMALERFDDRFPVEGHLPLFEVTSRALARNSMVFGGTIPGGGYQKPLGSIQFPFFFFTLEMS